MLEQRGVCGRAELVVIKTSGDRIQDRSLAEIGGKGLFVKELEEALLSGTVDVAVHSMKDMPAATPPGLALRTVLHRADARDALVARGGEESLDALPEGAVLGTSSLRRAALARARRPDLQVIPLRGNVGTRLDRLAQGANGLYATLLAAAGLGRLGLDDVGAHPVDTGVLLPAAGQGVLGIECRAADEALLAALTALEHGDTRDACTAERAFLVRVGGSCRIPLAGHATLDGDALWMRGAIVSPDGAVEVRGEVRGPRSDAARLGLELAEQLLDRGGRAILEALEGYEEGEVG
jgi:hydroxymethylbilane synthase